MPHAVEPLEHRLQFSSTFTENGFHLALNSKAILRVTGPADQAAVLEVVVTSVTDLGARSLANSAANLDDPYGPPVSRVVCFGDADGFEPFAFVQGTQADELEQSARSVVGDGDRFVYLHGAGGLNVAIPAADVTRVMINLGEKNDIVDIGKTGMGVDISGGAGNDTLTSAASRTTLRGGSGDDDLVATRAANPFLSGGAGNDRLIASAHARATIDGGTGKRDRSNIFSALNVERFTA